MEDLFLFLIWTLGTTAALVIAGLLGSALEYFVKRMRWLP